MDYPSGRQRHAGTSSAFHRCRVDGGGSLAGPLRTNTQMMSWAGDTFLLDTILPSNLPPANHHPDPAPDHAAPRPKRASPNLVPVSGGGDGIMVFADSDATLAWSSSGQQIQHGHPGTLAIPGFRDPALYQGPVNPVTARQYLHPGSRWPQHVFDTGPAQNAPFHDQEVAVKVKVDEEPVTSGPLTSAPDYASLLAPIPVTTQLACVYSSPPLAQTIQNKYYPQAPSNSGFLFQSPQPNQWPVSGPSLSHELAPTISALAAGSLPNLAHIVFNTAFDDHSRSHRSSIDASAVSPPPESHHTLSPASALGRYRRGSTASTEITVPDGLPGPALPNSPGQRKPSKTPPLKSFEFVPFKFETEAGQNGSQKRPAEEPPPGAASQTLRKVLLEGKNGEVQGAMTIFGHREKKRATFSDEKKARVKKVRKAGVCDRCKRAKKGCDLALKDSPYIPCDLCGSTELYKGVKRMPCFQSKLDELLFFRSGPAENEPLFTRRPMIYKLGEFSKKEALIKSVKLTQHIGGHSLTVYASEFEPMKGDVLSYFWKDPEGHTHEMKMPRYSLINIDKVKNHFLQYIEMAKQSYLQSLRADGDLAWMTVSAAVHFRKSRPESLTSLALDLWAVCRMIEIPWTICGEETLGIERVTDERNPHFNKIPIPPTMDTQLDQVVIKHFLMPLRERLIKKFDQVIGPPTPETWFDTYLASFLLLNHIEHLARHSVEHARLHAVRGKYSNVPFLEGALHWAKIILSRFHFVCNGAVPLKMNWDISETAKMARLEQWQVTVLKKTQNLITTKGDDIRALREKHKYEDPLYWSHQLFVEEWDKSPAHVIEEVE